MTRSIRALLGVAAVAAAASTAGAQTAQPPQDPTTPPSAERASPTTGAEKKSPRRVRTVSRGEVVREGPRAHPRDYYGADDPRCDDLCQREKMMDEKYGKDRERRPAARRGS